MTVEELIAELQLLDPGLRVIVDGYESGAEEPKLRQTRAIKSPNPDKEGDWIPEGDAFSRWPGGEAGEPVLLIGWGLNE